MRAIRILVVDDVDSTREALMLILGSAKDVEVVGEAADGLEAVERVRRLQPDVVLLDLKMPRVGGIEAIRLIRKERPETKMIVLTFLEGVEYMQTALRLGASAYVVKNIRGVELLRIIRQVMANKGYMLSISC